MRVEGSGWHLYVYRREYGWRLRGISKWYGERGVASVVYTRKLTSSIVGNWSLKVGVEAIYANIVTGNSTIDDLMRMIKPAISNLIWGKVSAVNVNLPEDGIFDVS